MLTIKGNQIFLTRGDTMFIKLSLEKEDGTDYVPTEADRIYFRLKKYATYPDILIEKQLAGMILELTPNDTIHLNFGTYRYEIELVTGDGRHYTVISDEPFTIEEEIENHG
jgi:hypothetical protein